MTAHGDNEFVLVSDLLEAVEGYKKLITMSLKKKGKEAAEEL